MVNVIYEGDDFKRMTRNDMLKLQRFVDSKKMGIFEVDYKDGKIKVEIHNREAVAFKLRLHSSFFLQKPVR
jgi:hypothetical protein